MGSTRLPGKVILDLCDKPVLWHVINRARQASIPDFVMVATTTNPEDDVIEKMCGEWNVPVFRGDVNDVLGRFCNAVIFLERISGPIDYIVRITADCPLIDPQVIDTVVAKIQYERYDYGANVDPPTFPDGLDVEVISRKALFYAHEHATLTSDREHVTPYLRRDLSVRKITIRHTADISFYRWTLDKPEDYEFIKCVYQLLYRPPKIFLLTEILNLLAQKPELVEINSHITRNEGYHKSLSRDRAN
jgi:spore coat polysaccharide biosynthesis protein SpsF